MCTTTAVFTVGRNSSNSTLHPSPVGACFHIIEELQLADSSWAIRYSSQGWTCARSGECRLLLLLLLLLAAAGRCSAWATAVPMLVQQRTYTRSSCSNSQETKTRRQLLAHAELRMMSDEPVSLFLIGSFAKDQKFHF